MKIKSRLCPAFHIFLLRISESKKRSYFPMREKLTYFSVSLLLKFQLHYCRGLPYFSWKTFPLTSLELIPQLPIAWYTTPKPQNQHVPPPKTAKTPRRTNIIPTPTKPHLLTFPESIPSQMRTWSYTQTWLCRRLFWPFWSVWGCEGGLWGFMWEGRVVYIESEYSLREWTTSSSPRFIFWNRKHFLDTKPTWFHYSYTY